jgi:hypothetical protein
LRLVFVGASSCGPSGFFSFLVLYEGDASFNACLYVILFFQHMLLHNLTILTLLYIYNNRFYYNIKEFKLFYALIFREISFTNP